MRLTHATERKMQPLPRPSMQRYKNFEAWINLSDSDKCDCVQNGNRKIGENYIRVESLNFCKACGKRTLA